MKLDVIELSVKNWDKMVSWYKKLGLRISVIEKDHKFALLSGKGGAMLGLFKESNLTHRPSRFTPHFKVNNLKILSSRLKKNAITIGRIQRKHWGNVLKITDPESNEIWLYEER